MQNIELRDCAPIKGSVSPGHAKRDLSPKKDSSRSGDSFADIALQRTAAWRDDLVQPKPAKLPKRLLPLAGSMKEAWPKGKKINDLAGLQQTLAEERRRHARFLENHAPPLPTFRLTREITAFDWRLETPQDCESFQRVLAGEGGWETVTIPHYGPPEGRATAFYRATFEVTHDMRAVGAVFVRFRGVDYKAHVFVNGAYVGSHEGFFAPFEFDCTACVRLGENVLVVKVENDAIVMGNSSWNGPSQHTEGDKIYAATGPGYDEPEVGWHHCPPGMGIYQSVTVEGRNRLHVSDVFVRPLLSEEGAEAWIEVFNCDGDSRSFSFELAVFGRNFRRSAVKPFRWEPRTVQVPGLSDMPKAGDNEAIELKAGPGVNYFKVPFSIANARLWSPESPWLYQLQVRLIDEQGEAIDNAERQFGMRSFTMDELSTPKGMFRLNGEPIRLRGANTMGFEQLCVMRRQWDRLRDDILLAKVANMNFLRLTQRPVQEEVYEWCDRLGMMTQTDLPLFGCLRRNQFMEAVRQSSEMERIVRSHPCNILVSYINEPFPNAQAKPHRHLVRSELTAFFSAADIAIRQQNPDRVIKPVDGDYDPPAPGLPDIHCYNGWYIGCGLDLGELHKGYWQRVKPDWYYGCGEFGAEGLDSVNTMRRYYPSRWLPANAEEEETWSPSSIAKSQTGAFHYLWFETPRTLEEWVARSQAHQAWVTKVMTEAFRRDQRMVSCAIHLFIDAFPAGWMKSIMDVDRQPKPAYFALRDAFTPLMVSLRADRQGYFSGEWMEAEVWLCHDESVAVKGATLSYRIELDHRVVATGRSSADVPACGSAFQGYLRQKIPEVTERGNLRVRSSLLDGGDRVVHENEISFDVFPRPNNISDASARVLGRDNGPARVLAESLSLKISREGSIILIDDFIQFQKRKMEIEVAVHQGARAIFLELPPGRYDLGGSELDVNPCAMGPRHFVSRDTGHPMTAGFQREDFKFWYDESRDCPTPLLRTVFAAREWRPILTSGNGAQIDAWKPAFAVAEKPYGRGYWRVCQLLLAGRIQGNPVADIFARRLIEGTEKGSRELGDRSGV